MAEREPYGRRDIVVIGASAGGVEALKHLAPMLSRDLPAAVFVVLHLPPEGRSALPGILSRAGPLPATHPEDGDLIQTGQIYVAPPDHHLVIEDGTIRLSRGPRENGYRPAIDRLFATAATTYGPRVTGVILSGALDDGTSGLAAVAQAGGATIVQEPAEALYAAMPTNAAANVSDAEVLPLVLIGERISELAGDGRNGRNGDPQDPDKPEANGEAGGEEMTIEQAPNPESPEYAQPGRISGFTCPECSGALWEVDEGGVLRYRCRVGHAFSAESFAAEQGAALEAALWAALRALEERVALCTKLAHRFAGSSHPRTTSRYEHMAEEARTQAQLIRDALEGLSPVAASA